MVALPKSLEAITVPVTVQITDRVEPVKKPLESSAVRDSMDVVEQEVAAVPQLSRQGQLGSLSQLKEHTEATWSRHVAGPRSGMSYQRSRTSLWIGYSPECLRVHTRE
jgi:hypothetical protein